MNLDSYSKALEQANTELAFALAQGDAAAEDAAAEKIAALYDAAAEDAAAEKIAALYGAAAEDAAAEKIAALEQLGRESWEDGRSVAETAAAAIIEENGAPQSHDVLQAMLAYAYAQGARAGMTEAVESFDRVLAKHIKSA